MITSLFLTPSPPLPAIQGAPMRNLTMIRAAATLGPVDLITFNACQNDTGPADELGQLCRRVERFEAPRRSMAGRATSLLRSSLPDMAHRLWSREINVIVKQWLDDCPYDIVQVEGIELARYIRAARSNGRPRVVFDDHNVEYLLQERAFEFNRTRPAHLHTAAYSAVQARRLRSFEREACKSSDVVVAVSEQDARRLRLLGSKEPAVIPNAIDVSSYPFKPDRVGNGRTLLFPATMDFRPNAEAAMWFIERVLPRISSALPDFQCYFAGRNPSADLIRRGQHDPRIAVTGEVPSMDVYWQRASVCILPLQVGGGSRFKALEAMAHGVPIVSTSLGMEGIEARPGHDYLRADDPASFADAVQHLLQNNALRQALAVHARVVVERGYPQSVVAERLSALYAQLCP
ncbi:MAG TPA: glycosyltransferase family 4 protein [Chloroflexota bacterium]|nr:glycosyltransferase family 4 protein [Chloroflexota bacterium]